MTTVPDTDHLDADLADLVMLETPEFYTEDPFPVYARLRSEAPVFYYEPLDLWLLTRYEDIRTVGRAPLVFSSSDGILLNDFRHGNVVASFFPPNAENFALDPPPRHNVLRNSVRKPFSPLSVTGLESRVREVCTRMLDALPRGVEIDWTRELAVPLPSTLIVLLLDLPLEDRVLIEDWSTEMLKMGAASSHEELAAAASGLAGMYDYFVEQLERRRREPGNDLVSALAVAEAAGHLSPETVHMMLGGVLAAGNETTRNFISNLAVVFDQHPDQYAKLVAEPSLAKNATEELLRYITPVRGFGRTAAEDTEINGQPIRAGQRVFMLYPAGNRDEDVYPEAETLDIERKLGSPHLAFGFGQHSCIGSALARLEATVLMEEMARRYRSVRLARPAVRDRQLLGNAYLSVDVVLE